MSRVVIFCTVLTFIFFSKSASASVKSCYACAGPHNDCVFNNRTDFLKMDCTTFKVEGESLIERTSQKDLLEKLDSKMGPANDDSEVGCITLTFDYDGDSPKERALKSCVTAKVFTADVCTYMKKVVSFIGGEAKECHFCKKDNCNGAISNFVNGSVVFLVCLSYLFKICLL